MARPRTNTLVTRILGGEAAAWSRSSLARGNSVTDDIGRAPGQVLAAIDGDHLTGDRGGVNQIAQGLGDLSGISAVAERDAGGFDGEILRRLVDGGQGGSWADGVHPDARRQSLGEGLGGRPKSGLAQGVAEEAGRQP